MKYQSMKTLFLIALVCGLAACTQKDESINQAASRLKISMKIRNASNPSQTKRVEFTEKKVGRMGAGLYGDPLADSYDLSLDIGSYNAVKKSVLEPMPIPVPDELKPPCNASITARIEAAAGANLPPGAEQSVEASETFYSENNGSCIAEALFTVSAATFSAIPVEITGPATSSSLSTIISGTINVNNVSCTITSSLEPGPDAGSFLLTPSCSCDSDSSACDSITLADGNSFVWGDQFPVSGSGTKYLSSKDGSVSVPIDYTVTEGPKEEEGTFEFASGAFGRDAQTVLAACCFCVENPSTGTYLADTYEGLKNTCRNATCGAYRQKDGKPLPDYLIFRLVAPIAPKKCN